MPTLHNQHRCCAHFLICGTSSSGFLLRSRNLPTGRQWNGGVVPLQTSFFQCLEQVIAKTPKTRPNSQRPKSTTRSPACGEQRTDHNYIWPRWTKWNAYRLLQARKLNLLDLPLGYIAPLATFEPPHLLCFGNNNFASSISIWNGE
ncbi:hypothetical protein I7I51_04253 [Histoplasma capsulatum]|uniref:Uncharacterized protein n=1 Tax=Ajellomyces capsulatus TaxID=5037 RepID=A0A8A1M6E7_AJECA|nr:hypothetical protein I7I51_04253 [Histoplasma capsulatum]